MAEQSTADYRGSLGRYALYGEIAAGGMATVHLARLLAHGFARTVAIKRLHPHLAKDPEFVGMFLEEARLAARVRHPNVVATLDVVSDDNELFLVMEYVAGESLSRLVRKTRDEGRLVPARYIVGIVCAALEGLHAAHEAKSEKGQPLGIVHRDVSPQNIQVGVDGIARVLDFGIAKATNRVQETRTDQLKGKVAYMSPEQLAKGPIDRRADVYSASVLLWEALTGQRLFQADDIPSLVYAIIHQPVRPPSAIIPTLSPELDAIVMKGLDRDADKRWSSAREMAEALERVYRPAPPREIGAWVEKAAGEPLAWRMDLVRQIEAHTASPKPPPMRIHSPARPLDMESGIVKSDSVPDGRDVGTEISGERTRFEEEKLRAPEPSMITETEHAPHSRVSRNMLIATGAVLLVAVILFALRWYQVQELAAEAPTVEPSPAPSGGTAPTESAIVIGTATASALPSAAPVTKVQTVSAPRVTRGSECDVPFTVDARGVRRPKPQCAPKK
ncbi:serine/threonine protein kinase [Labilithrix luteola]|uniref:Serine/threonine protein kinase n=1 Tax=Labilithrix luteola TaxID=1391654 RepID=A0A0K1PVA0_9BACT|nr:serine/threonine-protein kinase [Labilithrix luteola]AKU97054.1 serine/threonine protein kinase [Labilithrix luteola]